MSDCPTPTAHRRLDEAHTFWHGCLDEYQHPARFRSNLNAAIQALRNVTFALQKQKSLIDGFDDWYQPWRDSMKADSVLRWVVSSRNRIVKEGDLETNSVLRGWLITTYFDAAEASATSMPKGDAIEVIESGAADRSFIAPPRYTLAEVIEKFVKNAPRRVVDEATVAIERRWVDRALPEYELLDAMATAFGTLRSLLASAHEQARAERDCIGEAPASDCWAAIGAPQDDGRLACMVTSREMRTELFTIDGAEHGERSKMWPVAFGADPDLSAAAAQRYGEDLDDTLIPANAKSVVDFVPYFASRAKAILNTDPDHGWMVFFYSGLHIGSSLVVDAKDRQGKFVLAQRLAEHVAINKFDGFVMISEYWFAQATPDEEGHPIPPSEHPQRTEGLAVHSENSSGDARILMIPFVRHGPGDVTIGEEFELDPGDYNFVIPIRKIWNSPLLHHDRVPWARRQPEVRPST